MKITIFRLADGKRNREWGVRRYENRKRIVKFFASKHEAEKYAKDLRLFLKKGGDVGQYQDAAEALAGTDYPLADVVKVGLQQLQKQGTAGLAKNLTFRQATELVVAGAIKRNCRELSITNYHAVFRILNREFGDRIATCIGEAEAEAYIKNYPDRHGNVGKASPYTRETYLRHTRMVLRAAGVEKPFPNALARLPKEREIQFFSVDQVKKMLSSARSSERGMLALALFAGLRPTRLGEIPKSSINIPDRTIRIAGEFSKNHRSIFLETVSTENGHDFRPGPPPVLWSWLERYGFLPCNWGKIHRRMRAALGDFWIADGCRHTAATYYCCKFGVAATAELLGHTDTELVRRHYAGHATRAEADAFFAITPDSLPPAPEPDHPLAKVCISPAEMADHLRTRRISEIARLLGCSAGSIKSFCRRNGLKTPAAGYWNMKADNVASTIVESTTSAPVDTNSTAENSKNVGTGPTLAENPENAQRETNLTTTDGASVKPGSTQKPPDLDCSVS
jgi:integrase